MDIEEKLIITVIILSCLGFVSFLIFSFNGVYYGYSEGDRTGDIFKFSQKGLIWKSWEGEMYLGGISRVGNSESGYSMELDKFQFSIPLDEVNPEVISKLEECVENRYICKVSYKQWFISPIYQSTNYTIKDVIIKK